VKYFVIVSILIVAFMFCAATVMAQPVDDQYGITGDVTEPPTVSTESEDPIDPITRQTLPSTGNDLLMIVGIGMVTIAAGTTLLRRSS
jgi:LPXTG-motif cell wall-anchored protein